jgi:hypothetical protein
MLALAGVPCLNANAELIYGVSDQLNELVSFNSASPQTLLSAHNISGLQGNEELRGIDWIGTTLYGLGDGSHLYTINPNTGVATLVGAQFSTVLNGIDFGFNAGVSQLYVSSDLGQNLTINPVTAVATAGPNYSGASSSIDAMAYDYVSGNFYGVSAVSQSLYALNPVTGAVTLIGSSGVNFVDRVGLDISPNTDIAYFSGTVGGQTELFTVNKATGAMTLVGDIGTPGELTSGLDSLAVAPEPSAVACLVTGGLLFALLRRKK